jgi:hypothetical protein
MTSYSPLETLGEARFAVVALLYGKTGVSEQVRHGFGEGVIVLNDQHTSAVPTHCK